MQVGDEPGPLGPQLRPDLAIEVHVNEVAHLTAELGGFPAVTHRNLSPRSAASCHSRGSSGLRSSQRTSCSKYCSAMTLFSRPGLGLRAVESHSVDVVVARHGFSRPVPPASSTSPYLASCRRWNEHVPDDSPISFPAFVAVSGPCARSSPTSFIRTGCA